MSLRNKVLYDTNERQKIVDHIIQKNLYFELRGRCVWEEMEELEICPGRTWQSMKQHFQTHIIYSLDSLNINETEKNRILNCYHNYYKCIPVKRKELSSTSNETDNDQNAPKKCKVQSLRYKFVVQRSPEKINSCRDNSNRTIHENINYEKMDIKQNRDVGEKMMDKLNSLSFTNDVNGKNACGMEVDSSTEDSYSEKEDLSIIIYIKENMNWTNLQYFDGIYNDCQRDVLINRSAESIKKRFINVILPNIYKYRIVDIDEIPLFYDRACVDMPTNFEKVLEDYMKNNETSSVESVSTSSSKSYENSSIQNISLNENIQNNVMRNSEIVSGNNEKSSSKMLHGESNKDALLHYNENIDVQLQKDEITNFPIEKSVMRNSEIVSENNELSCAKSSRKILHEESNKDALHHNEKIDVQLQKNYNTHSPIQNNVMRNSEIVSGNNELNCDKSSSKILHEKCSKDALLHHNEKNDVQLQNTFSPTQNSTMTNIEIVSGYNELSYDKSSSKMLHEKSNKDALLRHNKKIDLQLQTNKNTNFPIQKSALRNSEIVSGNKLSSSKILHEENNKDALLRHNEKIDIQLQTNENKNFPIQKSIMRNSEIVSGNNKLSYVRSPSKMLHEESNRDAFLHHNEKIDVQLQKNADFKSQAEFLPGGLLNLRPQNFKKIETLQSDCSCELLRPVKNKSRVVHLPINVKHIKNNKYLEKICKCCTEVKSSTRKKSNKEKNCRKLDAPEESNELESTVNCKKNDKSAGTLSNDYELISSTNYMKETDLSKNVFCKNIDDIEAEIEIDSISNHTSPIISISTNYIEETDLSKNVLCKNIDDIGAEIEIDSISNQSSPIISMSRRKEIKLVNIDRLLFTEIELCNKITSDENILVNGHLNSIKSRSCSPIGIYNNYTKEDCEEICDKLNCVEDNDKEEPSPEKIDVAEEINFIANLPKSPENLKEQSISLNKIDYWDNNLLVMNAENNNSSLFLYDLNSNKGKLQPELTSRLVSKEIDYNIEENNIEPYSPNLIQKSNACNSEELLTVKEELFFENVVDDEGCDLPVLCNEILEEKFDPDEEIKNESSDSFLVSYNENDCKEEVVSDSDEEIKNEISSYSPVSYNEDDCKEETVSEEYIPLINEENEEYSPRLSNEYFTCFEDLPHQMSEDLTEDHFRDNQHNECSFELIGKVECEEEQIKVEYENLSENHINDVIENVNDSDSISMKETQHRTQNCVEEEIELFKEEPFEDNEPKLFDTEFPYSPVENSVEIKMEEEEIDINILFPDTEILLQIKQEEDPLNTDNYEEENDFDVKIKTEDGDLLNNAIQLNMEENSVSHDHSYINTCKHNTRKTYKNNMLSSKKSKKLLEDENVKYTNFLQTNLLSSFHISTNSLKNTDLDVDTSINDVTLSLNFEGNHSLEFNIPDLREIRLSCGMQFNNFSDCEDAAPLTQIMNKKIIEYSSPTTFNIQYKAQNKNRFF